MRKPRFDVKAAWYRSEEEGMSAPQPKYPAIRLLRSTLSFPHAVVRVLDVVFRHAHNLRRQLVRGKKLSKDFPKYACYPDTTMDAKGCLVHFSAGWLGSDDFQEEVMRLSLRELMGAEAPVLLPLERKVRKKAPPVGKITQDWVDGLRKENEARKSEYPAKGTPEWDHEVRMTKKELYEDR